ncbi:hypothetical protein P43SY_000754 [Pythium insidiosum]|uniref:Dynein attachment factor N-terminal domain-containing protein n=1 Tax=Pythium insidiosum TaxID=114742 RepID=A0AAD5LAJ7_PYTIN|nr:hypothetical protein P43SY_000754 [Pythium insidiosum]KAJ0396985.1 hypothetical protein ATCC90586_009002 [Pythium insidiosum]
MKHSKDQQALTSIEHGCFDTAALQDELARALEEDRKYKLTDSMKKRAIHTAASYDEFKNLVACADLKPVSQRELRSFSSSDRSTNLAYRAQTKSNRKLKGKSTPLASLVASVDTPPVTAVDFCRQWRRHLKSAQDRYRYLEITTAERLASIFKSDIDADLLAQIVQVLLINLQSVEETNGNATARANAARFSLEVLHALSY